MKVIEDKLEDVADIQAICLALAELSIARPGWTDYLGTVAAHFENGERLYDQCRQNHSNPLAAKLSGEPLKLSARES